MVLVNLADLCQLHNNNQSEVHFEMMEHMEHKVLSMVLAQGL